MDRKVYELMENRMPILHLAKAGATKTGYFFIPASNINMLW